MISLCELLTEFMSKLTSAILRPTPIPFERDTHVLASLVCVGSPSHRESGCSSLEVLWSMGRREPSFACSVTAAAGPPVPLPQQLHFFNMPVC